ncbi:hypothetical protein B4589_016840 (plasmid) [Halolamina sp. CBA1230]|uniref:hypothetical protein n=1 Tax=Halolamina sp. CBA1230 TaxID=1853690 RepID=UPI00117B1A86|nr:hypothetical protein [Halolamina sp. CBA1230]QKY22079.1 hypothetical protein B4589_016840 [Halolamina sp. CBA1230]
MSVETVVRRTFITDWPQTFADWKMNDYLGLSRRDVGAGLATAGSAYVAAALFALLNLLSGSGSRGGPIPTLGMIVTLVVALTVATVVWRVTMPDEPNPRYGPIAGAFSGVVSVFVFTTLIGITATLIESPAGAPPDGTVFESISFVAVIVVWGALFTLPLIVPIAASVGTDTNGTWPEDS